MVTGGVILFCLAMVDLTVQGRTRRAATKELGAVPIGTPLIVGPGRTDDFLDVGERARAFSDADGRISEHSDSRSRFCLF